MVPEPTERVCGNGEEWHQIYAAPRPASPGRSAMGILAGPAQVVTAGDRRHGGGHDRRQGQRLPGATRRVR
jgi:hypothetical protein